MLRRLKALIFLLVATVINVMIQIPAKDAVTNFFTYLRPFGINPPDSWLQSESVDHAVRIAAFAALVICIVWTIFPSLFSQIRFSRKKINPRNLKIDDLVYATFGEGPPDQPHTWAHKTKNGSPLVERVKFLLRQREPVLTTIDALELAADPAPSRPKKLKLTFADDTIVYIQENTTLSLKSAMLPEQWDEPSARNKRTEASSRPDASQATTRLSVGGPERCEPDAHGRVSWRMTVMNRGDTTIGNVKMRLRDITPRPRYRLFPADYPYPVGMCSGTKEAECRINPGDSELFEVICVWRNAEGDMYTYGLDTKSPHQNFIRIFDDERWEIQYEVTGDDGSRLDLTLIMRVVGGVLELSRKTPPADGTRSSRIEHGRLVLKGSLTNFPRQPFEIEQAGRGDPEAVDFAEQLGSSLKECGWIGEIKLGVPSRIAPPVGVSLYTVFNPQAQDNQPMHALDAALCSLGIRVFQSDILLRGNEVPGKIYISIGACPA